MGMISDIVYDIEASQYEEILLSAIKKWEETREKHWGQSEGIVIVEFCKEHIIPVYMRYLERAKRHNKTEKQLKIEEFFDIK